MLTSSRKTLTAIATVSALAGGGAALAGAATNGGSSKPSSTRPHPAALTGDTADKVKAAALEKVPGATVLRLEAGGPDGSTYHAHVRKADGTEVTVLVNASFEATSVQTRPAGGPGGPGHRGPGGPGGPDGRGHGGPGGPGGHADEALTGDTAAKVKAAALDKVPGATVLRTEKGGHGSTYHAHVRKADGTEVVVLVNSSFEATSVEDEPEHP